MASHLSGKISTIFKYLQNKKFLALLGVVSEKYFGVNFHNILLKSLNGGDQIYFEFNDITMVLSLNDPGISRELLHFGEREVEATEMMRTIYTNLEQQNDDKVVIIEIGANRGYYAFQACKILGDVGEVYAIEPAPENIKALKEGKNINDFDSTLRVDQMAIGNENGESKLLISNHSNCHTLGKIQSAPESIQRKYNGETRYVKVMTLDDYVDLNGIDPAEIDVVRMDVEGYEWHVFDGMDSIISADTALTIFCELHPHRVQNRRILSILETLENNNFNILSSGDAPEDYDGLKSYLSTNDMSHTVELIVDKN
jgi:FkbM family methyltransferase